MNDIPLNGTEILAWAVFAVGLWTLFGWALSAGTLVSNWLENRQNRTAS